MLILYLTKYLFFIYPQQPQNKFFNKVISLQPINHIIISNLSPIEKFNFVQRSALLIFCAIFTLTFDAGVEQNSPLLQNLTSSVNAHYVRVDLRFSQYNHVLRSRKMFGLTNMILFCVFIFSVVCNSQAFGKYSTNKYFQTCVVITIY